MKTVESYLTDIKVRYITDDEARYYQVSSGVPQGSVSGALLWNITYDGIPMPQRTKVVEFANDILLLQQ